MELTKEEMDEVAHAIASSKTRIEDRWVNKSLEMTQIADHRIEVLESAERKIRGRLCTASA